MDQSKFTSEDVKLVLKIVTNEQEKEDFIKTLFPADTEVNKKNSKILSVADYKNNFLYVFKKPSEGHITLEKFSAASELTLSNSAHKDLLFYSEVAKLVAGIQEKQEQEEEENK